MWVRSQCKKILGKYICFNIVPSYRGNEFKYAINGWHGSLEDSYFQIGFYATEERAIEVLGDIQAWVVKDERLEKVSMYPSYPYVYEVPEV